MVFSHFLSYGILDMQQSTKAPYKNPTGMAKKELPTKIPSATTVTLSLHKIMSRFVSEYHVSTSQLIKIIDVYLLYIFLTGILQGIYVLCARTTFPLNAMLAGWISTIGSFIFAGKNTI
jgi:oligosaccharyltransferase complex subunit epsilon